MYENKKSFPIFNSTKYVNYCGNVNQTLVINNSSIATHVGSMENSCQVCSSFLEPFSLLSLSLSLARRLLPPHRIKAESYIPLLKWEDYIPFIDNWTPQEQTCEAISASVNSLTTRYPFATRNCDCDRTYMSEPSAPFTIRVEDASSFDPEEVQLVSERKVEFMEEAPMGLHAESLSVLCSSGQLRKHGRWGNPKMRHVCLNVLGNLHWDEIQMDPHSTNPSSRYVRLKDCVEVISGKHTNVFKRSVSESALNSRCFSLRLKNRSLDLEASSSQERKQWVDALKEAVALIQRGVVNIFTGALDSTLAGLEYNWEKFLHIGGYLRKYGRLGEPKRKWVNAHEGVLYWSEHGATSITPLLQGTSRVHLSNVIRVSIGKTTKVFQRACAEFAPASCCFSLVLPDRTVDLQADSDIACSKWVECLREAIANFQAEKEETRRLFSRGLGFLPKPSDDKVKTLVRIRTRRGQSPFTMNESESPLPVINQATSASSLDEEKRPDTTSRSESGPLTLSRSASASSGVRTPSNSVSVSSVSSDDLAVGREGADEGEGATITFFNPGRSLDRSGSGSSSGGSSSSRTSSRKKPERGTKELEQAMKCASIGNMRLAVSLMADAANQGNAEAAFNLAQILELGRGVRLNMKKALTLYRRAAARGHVLAMVNLAAIYHSGRNEVPKDREMAAELYRQAAEAGDGNAQYNLAVCLLNGDGVTVNEAEAVKWLTLATGHGILKAYTKLAMCLFSGTGAPVNRARASQLLMHASTHGDPHAQYNLGLEYLQGKVLDRDMSAAYTYFCRAAESGHPRAQFELARCLENGTGTERNPHQAKLWYRRAASKGITSGASDKVQPGLLSVTSGEGSTEAGSRSGRGHSRKRSNSFGNLFRMNSQERVTH